MKSGQYVMKNSLLYMFLGYVDYKRKRCLLADRYGNTHVSWIEDVN
jgi:hypothetical protein